MSTDNNQTENAEPKALSDIEQAASVIPPIAGVVPESGIYGSLNDDERQQFVLASRQAQTVESRIGRLEIEKSGLLHKHIHFQQVARDTITAAAKRLGVPPEQPFRLDGDRIVAEGLSPQ